MLRKSVEDQDIVSAVQASRNPLTVDEIAKKVGSVRAKISNQVTSLAANGVLARLDGGDVGQARFMAGAGFSAPLSDSSSTVKVDKAVKDKSTSEKLIPDNTVRFMRRPRRHDEPATITPAPLSDATPVPAEGKAGSPRSFLQTKALILSHLLQSSASKDHLTSLVGDMGKALDELIAEGLIESLSIYNERVYDINEDRIDDINALVASSGVTDEQNVSPEGVRNAPLSSSPMEKESGDKDIAASTVESTASSEPAIDNEMTAKNEPVKTNADVHTLEVQVMQEVAALVQKLVKQQMEGNARRNDELKAIGHHVKDATEALQLAVNSLKSVTLALDNLS